MSLDSLYETIGTNAGNPFLTVSRSVVLGFVFGWDERDLVARILIEALG